MVINRHKRGKASVDADVCPDSLMDKDSYADRGARIWHSNISQSWIEGKVLDSAIRSSRILAAGEVVCSTIIDSTVDGGAVYGSHVQNSIVSGGLIRNGKVISSEVSGGTIQGGAVVFGFNVDRDMRIGDGLWGRPPRYIEIDNASTHIGVTESTDGFAYIACQRKRMETWVKGKARFGKVMGWSDDVLDLLDATFTDWLNNPMPTY
jgi:hypothetical protein